MKTITFYSYKGGVGRSLALSNVANRLSEFGKKVCLLDFDLEAPGLHLKFEKHIGIEGVQNGLVDYIYDFSSSKKVPKKISNFVTDIIFEKGRANIALIAAGNTLTAEYWRKLSAIDWKNLFYDDNSVGIEFFFNLKAQIKSQLNPDFLLIDSRTGITDISGITMSILADEVVLLAANNKENLEGITQVIKTLSNPSNSIHNKSPKINFVLSRIPYFTNPKLKPRETNVKNTALRVINEGLKESGIENFSIDKLLVIHSDPELELEEKLKISYDFENQNDTSTIPIGLDYLELFEEVTRGMITDKEKKEFDSFIKVESLIEKSIANPDLPSRIRGLKSAIKINPRSSTAYQYLGIAHFEIKSYQEALEFFKKGIEINPSIEYNVDLYQGACYFNLGMIDEALKIYENAIKVLPDESYFLVQTSNLYTIKGEFHKALEYAAQSLRLTPENDDAWNSYGNTLRRLGRHDEALDAIFKALEINPQNLFATSSLAEIYAETGNLREFYKNLELSFSFGMSSEDFQMILKVEKVYVQFYNDKKFLSILEKYKIDIDWSLITENNND